MVDEQMKQHNRQSRGWAYVYKNLLDIQNLRFSYGLRMVTDRIAR